jgi:SAM-dependent methyltransferase
LRPATTNEVLDLLDASYHAAALGAAMELGLFWLLEEKPRDASEIAISLGIPGRRCHYWLQLLAASGLLEEGPEGYAPSPTARTAILETYSRESWAHLAAESRERLPGIQNLAHDLRVPGSVWQRMRQQAPDYLQDIAEDKKRALSFTRMLYELHQPLARELAATTRMDGVDRLLDLGGGSGVISIAMLRRHPALAAVVVDLPSVCEAGRKIADEQGLSDRIEYHPADFLRDDLPGGFGMVIECDVNVYSTGLFRKVKDALLPGGRFVIIDQFAPAEGVAHPTRRHWAFEGSLIRPDYRPPTAAATRILLKSTGFRIETDELLPAIGGPGSRFNSEMTRIEARV